MAYREWHRSLGEECLYHDVDGIEWRLVDGELVPVAVIELTRFDGAPDLPQSYLDGIETRYLERDLQGRMILQTAERLRVPAYVVVFSEALSEFYVFHLQQRKWWKRVSPEDLRRWIKSLKPAVQKGGSQ